MRTIENSMKSNSGAHL